MEFLIMKPKYVLCTILLILALALFCGCSAPQEEAVTEEPQTEEVAEETPFIAPHPLVQGMNGINNIYCAGLSYDAGDVLYYIKEDENGSGCGTLRMVGSDGADTLLYTASGNMEYLTVTADKVYFVVTLYKSNGHFKEDVFCSLDRAAGEVTEHFSVTDRVIAMNLREDGIYLCTTTERSGSKLLRTDAAGREPEVVWEQEDIITDCVFHGDEVYFIANNRLWCSNLIGANRSEMASSLYMLGAPMVMGDMLYYVEYDSYLCPTLNRMEMATGTVTPLATYGEHIRLNAINLYNNMIYLVKSTVDVEGNAQSAEIVSLYSDGSGETSLFAEETEVYGLSASRGNLYFYDLAKGTALSLPLQGQ